MTIIKSKSRVNPLRTLTLALVLGLVLLLVLGSVIWSMYQSLSVIGVDALKLQRLIGTIAHLNEALTMCARMSVATGDEKWEKRYRTVQPALDEAIAQTATMARAEYEKNYASQTKLAYSRLLEMESVGMALARRARLKEAARILFGEEYEAQKALYSQGIDRLTANVQSRIADEIASFRRRIWHVGILAVFSGLILAAAWVGVSINLRRHLDRRRAAEEELAEEKEQLAVTLRSIGEGVITTDIAGHVRLVNRAAEALTGWPQDEALDKPLHEVFTAINDGRGMEPVDLVAQVFRHGAVRQLAGHVTLLGKDGTRRCITHVAAPIRDRQSNIVGVVLVFQDVTEMQQMQREALKAEKLESIGILAGGIAHDFNNILTAVLGNLSLAKLAVDPTHQAFPMLESAEKASVRAKDLTHQLLTFAKGGAPIRRTASLRDILTESTSFALRGSNVQCNLDVPDDLRPVNIDEGQIGQVIHNLVLNADQAMPEGGTVTVRAENYRPGRNDDLSQEGGEYVKISVMDEGVGIPAEHLPRLFDPYFTTKKTGTGLGLATSYAAVKRHQGRITVSSEPGKGTTFAIFLPACRTSARIKEAGPEDFVYSGCGKILVMDDDQVVRDLVREMLTILGYEVCVTRDGGEALTAFREHWEKGHPFDAVIMDLTIPGGIGGKEVILRLRELDSDVRAIVSSGYCNDPIMGDFKKHGFCGVLPKPYTAVEMGKALRAALNGKKKGVPN